MRRVFLGQRGQLVHKELLVLLARRATLVRLGHKAVRALPALPDRKA